MREWIGDAATWRREIAAALAVGLFLGVLGPFGTFLNGGFPVRAFYWCATSLGSLIVYGLGVRFALYFGARHGQPVWFVLPLAVAAISAPMAALIALFATSLWPHIKGRVSPAEWYGEVMLMSLAWNLVAMWSRAHFPHSAASASAPLAPRGSFLDRLPPRLGRELLCLEMEDHYVRAHTTLGSDLVLLSLKDALAELGDIEGLQVHRSWWVAKAAVIGPVWSGRNLRLRLSNGGFAPVSRSSVAKLRESGWLDSE